MQEKAATRVPQRAEQAVERHAPEAILAGPQLEIDASPRVLLQRQRIAAAFGAVPPRSAAAQAVVQRATFTLSFRQVIELNLNVERKNLFGQFLNARGYDYKAATRLVNTFEKGPATFAAFQQEFESYVLQNQTVELAPEVRLEKIRLAGELLVRKRYEGCEIETLVTEGKNNSGIYRVQTKKGEDLVVKVLSTGFPAAEDAMKRVPGLQERFSPMDRGDKIDIGTPLNFELIKEDQFAFALATYKAHGIMSLNRAMELQDLPEETLEAAARGLGSRIAGFHYGAIESGRLKKEKGEEKSPYLVHGDLNASNLMLDMRGVVGLVDVDSLKLGTIDQVKWDLSSLLGSLSLVLTARYGKVPGQAVFVKMKRGFAKGYTERLARVPDHEIIFKQVAELLV